MLVDINAKNKFGRIPMEEALLAGRADLGELLAPFSKMEDDKIYCSNTVLEEVNEEEEKIEEEEDSNSEY
jgi:ankyrin repeat protein